MLPIIILVLGLFFDQFTKYLVVTNIMPLPGGELVVWDGVVSLLYTENKGAAFGLLDNAPWLFITVSLLACAGMAVLLLRWKPKRVWVTAAISLVFTGALGNLIDRILNGFVVDFVYVKLINFAVFNVADVFVVCGTIALAIYLLAFYDKDSLAKTLKEAPEGNGQNS